MSYKAIALISKNSDLDFSGVLDELDKFTVLRSEKSKALIDVNGYQFECIFRQEKFVQEETEDLLATNKVIKPNFLPGNIRVEIYGPDDINMDHFNDFILIIGKLASHPSILVYELAGQAFI